LGSGGGPAASTVVPASAVRMEPQIDFVVLLSRQRCHLRGSLIYELVNRTVTGKSGVNSVSNDVRATSAALPRTNAKCQLRPNCIAASNVSVTHSNANHKASIGCCAL
jgi:hypothetical protein